MAGIVGILGSPRDPARTDAMLDKVKHRGPDHRETVSDGDLAGGVCAADLSPARGTGFAREGDTVVLLDGEVYNARPQGKSDADVVLDLFHEYGRTFPGHLEGVFAAAVWNGEELLLARDAVGVRPMYVGRTAKRHVCFASEVKALVGLAEEIQDLPPAVTFSSRSGIAGYLPRYPEASVPSDFDEAVAAVRETLTGAVERRLEDGAIGACLLSGGLDSSINAVVAYELGARMPLVTVGMEGAADVENAKIVADHLDAEHHIRLYTQDEITDSVRRAVYALESFDEDCVSGTISNLFASSKAAEMTNCILSGEGGDELFGGYHLLKDLPTEAERLAMMHNLIAVAYNTALQRLDRAMMANGITYRTPFIDSHVIALAQQLPVRWKIHDSGQGKWTEKHILREAFKDLLPETIYRRVKLRFAAGTGTDERMDAVAEGKLDGDFTEAARKTPGGYRLNSPKELWYYQLFKQDFPGLHFESLVGRWDPGK